jgi:glycosyltransferase involved in cell wall biosynthesis
MESTTTRSADPGQPLVSVVIPTYDRPRYLQLALASALAQTYRRLEVIVQDNASPEDPSVLVAAFADPRVRFYRNSQNIGQTPNILAAVARATGPYVAILGDDDLWQPDFIATLVAALESHPDVVVAFCDHDIIDSEGRRDAATTERISRRFGRHRMRRGVHRRFDDIALVYRSICVVSGALIRRDAIDWCSIPQDIPLSSDIYVAYLLAATGRSCWYAPERLMQYRYHRSAITNLNRSKIGEAEWGLAFWSTFLRDRRIGHHAYYKMVCARKGVLIVLDRLRRRDWKGIGEKLVVLFKMGLIDPRVILYHLFYFVRFQFMGMRRLVP